MMNPSLAPFTLNMLISNLLLNLLDDVVSGSCLFPAIDVYLGVAGPLINLEEKFGYSRICFQYEAS
jgi:hypothetical protein